MRLSRKLLLIGLSVAVSSGVLTGPAAAEVQEEVTKIVTGFTTDPKWVGSPGAIGKALREGKTLEELRLLPSATGDVKAGSPDDERRAAERSAAEYGTPSEKYGPVRPLAPSYDYITVAECRNNSAQSGRPEGWIKNHFAYCAMGKAFAAAVRCLGPVCLTVGGVDARITFVGYGKKEARPGSTTDRFADFEMDVDQVAPWGAFANPAASFEVGLECGGWPRPESCQIGARNGREDFLAGWIANGRADFEVVSPAAPSSPGNGEQVAIGVFRPTFDFDLPGVRIRPDESKGNESGLRFDSASYLPYKQGSIFDRVTPWISYSVQDKEVEQAAWHIYDALNHPETTKPVVPGKQLPGKSASDTVHRLYHDKDRRKANRAEAVSFCRAEWPGYPDLGQDCDEYPFACSYEGSARYKYDGDQYRNRFSARPINAPHNRTAGARLGAWFGDDRILDRDAFYVRILNAPARYAQPAAAAVPPDEEIGCGDEPELP